MPPSAKDSFVLFDVGHHESMLKLGDLVLHNYNDPLAAYHYTCRATSQVLDIASTQFSEFSAFHKHGPTTGIQLEAAGFIKLGLSFKNNIAKLIVAESAERVVLRNPSEFLKNVVLKDKSARDAIALWSSAGLTDRVLKLKWARAPKIWMMTGMYLFEKTKIVTVKTQDIGAEVGISSEIVAALTSAPVGGSVNLSQATSAEITAKVPERKVWAAQYQLLNSKYIDPAEAANADLLSTVSLYLVRSKGQLRNSGPRRKSVAIEAFDEVDSETEKGAQDAEKTEDEGDLSEAEYVNTLQAAVADLEEDLKSDSSDEDR